MRDFNRIYKVCFLLGTVWTTSKFSDLRFFQVVELIKARIGKDPYYVEDDEVIKILTEMSKEKKHD